MNKNGRHEQSCVRDPGTTFFSPREKIFPLFFFSSQFSGCDLFFREKKRERTTCANDWEINLTIKKNERTKTQKKKQKKRERDYVLCVLRLSPDKLSFTGLFFCDFMKKKTLYNRGGRPVQFPPQKKYQESFPLKLFRLFFVYFQPRKFFPFFIF